MKKYKILSIILIVTGLMLMIFKIYSDSEPGAIPLMMIIAGTGWYFFTRKKISSQKK